MRTEERAISLTRCAPRRVMPFAARHLDWKYWGMPTVAFTPNLQRHLDCPELSVEAATVSEALAAVFRENPRLRSYVVDEHGRLRQHVAVFVGGELIHDRVHMSDPVAEGQDVFVMQALSGG